MLLGKKTNVIELFLFKILVETKGSYTPNVLCKNKRKFNILWIWIWCVKYINTEGVAFLQKNSSSKKGLSRKEKKKEKLSWWWAGPDLPNEEKEETRILVHPILTRTQQQGEYYGLVQEWKRYHSHVCTFQDVSGAVWSLVSRVGIPYEEVQKSFQRATLVGVVFGCVSEVKSYFFLIISMSLHIQNQNQHQNTVQLWIWAMNALVANDQRSDYLDPKHQEKLRLVQRNKCFNSVE